MATKNNLLEAQFKFLHAPNLIADLNARNIRLLNQLNSTVAEYSLVYLDVSFLHVLNSFGSSQETYACSVNDIKLAHQLNFVF